jgi:hypothetical protein
MHWILGGLLVVAAAPSAFAKCGDDPGDEAAVAAARAQAEIDCPCATATNHGQYVKCVAQVAKERSKADPSLLPKNCKGVVKKCAAKSTCGKPDAVHCCVTKGNKTKCKLAKDVAKCTAKSGVSTGPGSCCDACSPSGAFLDPVIF